MTSFKHVQFAVGRQSLSRNRRQIPSSSQVPGNEVPKQRQSQQQQHRSLPPQIQEGGRDAPRRKERIATRRLTLRSNEPVEWRGGSSAVNRLSSMLLNKQVLFCCTSKGMICPTHRSSCMSSESGLTSAGGHNDDMRSLAESCRNLHSIIYISTSSSDQCFRSLQPMQVHLLKNT